MKSTLFTFLFLFTASGFATETIKGLAAAEDCNIANTPSSSISIARPVTGKTTKGKSALKQLESLSKKSNLIMDLKSDSFFDTVQVYSRILNKEVKTDATYPESGCTRSAVLKEVCEYDTASKTAKCGQLCKFDYSCIDNR